MACCCKLACPEFMFFTIMMLLIGGLVGSIIVVDIADTSSEFDGRYFFGGISMGVVILVIMFLLLHYYFKYRLDDMMKLHTTFSQNVGDMSPQIAHMEYEWIYPLWITFAFSYFTLGLYLVVHSAQWSVSLGSILLVISVLIIVIGMFSGAKELLHFIVFYSNSFSDGKLPPKETEMSEMSGKKKK